jgi:hypothetical protein
MKLTDMLEASASSRLLLRCSWAVRTGLLSAWLVGCGYGDHDHHYRDDDYVDPVPALSCGDVEEAVIDADEALEVDPGVGAGAFIEYESDGTYHVTTSCDSDESGTCYWDILVTPLDDGPVLSLSPLDLETDDSVSLEGNSVRLVASTDADFDGFILETDPGVGVRFDVLLDEACGNRYMFWVGDGALRSGAPSNPIDLIPSE